MLTHRSSRSSLVAQSNAEGTPSTNLLDSTTGDAMPLDSVNESPEAGAADPPAKESLRTKEVKSQRLRSKKSKQTPQLNGAAGADDTNNEPAPLNNIVPDDIAINKENGNA